MAKRIGRYTIKMENETRIIGWASAVGKEEAKGPLKDSFDTIFYDEKWGEETFEKAEAKIQREVMSMALNKARLKAKDIDVVFAGDLLNQCISSSFGLKDYNVPFLGQYGACSTMAQTLLLSAIFVDSGCAKNACAVTSSHFCSAERQFRFPLEYGGQRTPTSQHTVTGGGCAVVSANENYDLPKINAVTVGKIVDLGIKDANNMGASMAPSACEVIKNFLRDTATVPSDYDLIITGDLGEIGSKLLIELLKTDNINIEKNHNDCGLLIFDREKQDLHAGGSGCGCAGSVLCSYILNHIRLKNARNIIFVATGALMSQTSAQQGNSIPSISHLVNIVI